MFYSEIKCTFQVAYMLVGFSSHSTAVHRQHQLLMCRRARRKRISLVCQKPLCCVMCAHDFSRLWAYIENPSQSSVMVAVLT